VFDRLPSKRVERAVLFTDLSEHSVEIGMPVEMVTRPHPLGRKLREDGNQRGMLVYGYKFRPVLQHWQLCS
jgi:uncharacterized OB-fold protein